MYTGHNEDSAEDEDEPDAYCTRNDFQGRRQVGIAEEKRHQARTTLDATAKMQTVPIERSKMVVYKNFWVNTKGNLGRTKAEVVSLDANVVLLK